MRMVRDIVRAMEVDEYAEAGDARVDMSLNVNPLGPPPAAVEAVNALDPSDLAHYRHPDDGLRAKVADRLGTAPDRVMLTAGCDDALQTAALALIDQDAEVAIPAPSFPRYAVHARKMGADARFVHGDLLHPSPRELETVDGDVLVLANPQNPTGERFSRAEVEDVVDAFPGTVVLDEALAHPDETHADLVDAGAVVVGSFSKVFGLAGLRAGYLLADDLAPFRKCGSPFQVSAAAQAAVRAAVDADDHLARTRAVLERERAFLKTELAARGYGTTDSASGTMLVGLDGTRYEGRSSAFVDDLAAHGVKVVDGGHFRGVGASHVRISVRDRGTDEAFISVLDELEG